MLIAVDFDGTIVQHKYPEIGEPLEGAFETLRDLVAAGNRLVLYTCREDCKRRKYLTEAVNFCRENGVEFVSVNENALDDDFRAEHGCQRRKPYAQCYIDDSALLGFPGWHYVRELFGLPALNHHNEEDHGMNSDPGIVEQQEGTLNQGCEVHPGCLGTI